MHCLIWNPATAPASLPAAKLDDEELWQTCDLGYECERRHKRQPNKAEKLGNILRDCLFYGANVAMCIPGKRLSGKAS